MNLKNHATPRLDLKEIALFCAPLLVWLLLIGAQLILGSPSVSPPPHDTSSSHVTPRGRTVLVIVDSLRQEAIDAHMPHLRDLATTHTSRPVNTCSANFTLVCIQTMLEGRQSPFVARLHNFTGTSGSPRSLPGAIARAGRPLHMISDYTLDSLYGTMATDSINVELWPGSHLDHDLRTIEKGITWIAQPDTDVIVLHLIGTDKAAHRLTPGHPDYAEHFTRVDDALAALITQIDPQRDHLIITGDHGHDAKGHHTQTSVALFKSALLEPLLGTLPPQDKLDQTELAHLMALATQTPLHLDYEGRYIGMTSTHRDTLPEHVQHTLSAFETAQIKALRSKGLEGRNFEALITHKHEEHTRKTWAQLVQTIPTALLYLLWLLWMMTTWRPEAALMRRRSHASLILGLLAMGLGLSASLLPTSIMVAMSLCLAAGACVMLRLPVFHQMRRPALMLAVLMCAAIATSLIGEHWRGFFHSTGTFIIQVPLFFVGLIALGMLLSKIQSNSAWRALPASLTMLCLCALPSGVYYYQFGRNITQGTLIGFSLLLLMMAWRVRHELVNHARTLLAHPRTALMCAGAVMTAALLLWQRGSSWIWQAGIVRWLDLKHPELAIPLFILCSTGFIASLRTTRWRIIAGLNLLWIAGYSVLTGELGWPIAVSVVVVALALSLSLRLESDLRHIFAPDSDRDTLTHEQLGIWSAAIILMIGWTMLEGFFFENVDFNFTFAYLSDLKHESEVAAASSVLTYFKYAPLLWLGVIALMNQSAQNIRRTTGVMLWALHIKLLMLLLQITTGALNATQKLHELATSDLMFIMALVLHMLPGLFIAIWLETRTHQHSK